MAFHVKRMLEENYLNFTLLLTINLNKLDY